ncbi:MAG: hypothetical protein WD469_13795 [Paenibacillaceae bacterium]
MTIHKNQRNQHQKLTSRETVIQEGLHFLEGTHIQSICKLCISKGGSCCTGCMHLKNGSGCQLRNTSCTAWLCGFLKYLLYEAELLENWTSFWERVPGQDYRKDYTPSAFYINKQLMPLNISELGKALTEDLNELANLHLGEPDYIIRLREEIDKDLIYMRVWRHTPEKTKTAKAHLKRLTKDLTRFHLAIEQYHQSNYQEEL